MTCKTGFDIEHREKMSTVKDVAREAGVSVGTISKVLSNNTTVKTALRERVLKAASELNYRPNMAARAAHQQNQHPWAGCARHHQTRFSSSLPCASKPKPPSAATR